MAFPTVLPLSLKAPSTRLPPLTDQTEIDLISQTAEASRNARVFELAPSEAQRIKNAASKDNSYRLGSNYQNGKPDRRDRQNHLSGKVKDLRTDLAGRGISENYVAEASFDKEFTERDGSLTAASLKRVGSNVLGLFLGQYTLTKDDYEGIIQALKPEYNPGTLSDTYRSRDDENEATTS